MAEQSRFDQLDLAVQAVVAGRRVRPPADAKLAALARVAAELRGLPRVHFKAQLKADLERRGAMGTAVKRAAGSVREGVRTVTPYLIAADGPELIEFVKRTFGAEEKFRAVGSAGGIHCEVHIEDSKLMMGGGGPGLSFRGPASPGAFHVYVRDCDATYQRALEGGAVSIDEPADQFYGERSASVKDPAGNHWYIATFKGESYKPEGAPVVQPCLHPLRAEPMIQFLKRAFGAEELGRHASPEGVIHHVTMRVGSSHLEMGEAQGPYQPMASTFYVDVEDADAVYRRALQAGATSISEPADQPYGARAGGVKDAFGHTWYIATPIKELTA